VRRRTVGRLCDCDETGSEEASVRRVGRRREVEKRILCVRCGDVGSVCEFESELFQQLYCQR
jgi:hypothetical protein